MDNPWILLMLAAVYGVAALVARAYARRGYNASYRISWPFFAVLAVALVVGWVVILVVDAS